MPGTDRAAEPPLSWDDATVRRVGARVVDLVARHLAELPTEPVFRPMPIAESAAHRVSPAPVEGRDIDAVLDAFAAAVEPYPFGNGHPRFFGWVNSPPLPAGVLATALAAAMNPSVGGGNHAAVHVEHEVLRWCRELLGLPESFTGLMTSGTSTSVLVALAAARYAACAAAGWDVRARGLQASTNGERAPRLAVYASAQAHSCHAKALEALGLGSDSLREAPVDADLRVRPEELERLIAADVAAGVVPMAVIGTLGTVTTGAVDPLDELANVAAHHGAWFHVDGAYGAPAVLLPEVRARAGGLDRADSVAFDAHKWLYLPVASGVLLLRDAQRAREAWSLVPAYLRTDGDLAGVGGPPWFSEYGLEQTRPFRALPLWVALQHLGFDGYRRLIARDIEHARALAEAVRADPRLELYAPPSLSIVCLRVVPARSSEAPASDGAPDDRGDRLNQAVLTRVQLGGGAFLTGAEVDGRFWLRACLVNHRTTPPDLEALLAEIRAAADAVEGAMVPMPGAET